MVNWRSWWMWLVVVISCVVLGLLVGVLVVPMTSRLCIQFFDKSIVTDFGIRGTLVEKSSNSLLIRFSEKEVMWISLREGYKITQKDSNGKIVEKSLGDLQIGDSLTLGKVGLSSRLENLMYADLVGIN